MEKEFVPYELVLRMKALGFDEPCLAIHSNANPKTGFYTLNKYRLKLIKQGSQKDKGVKAPLYQQAFRWFRESHGLKSSISYSMLDDTNWYFQFDKSGIEYGFKTYEEAELACLDKLLKIIENKSE
jgi:hypothetical protein